jgi:hypothetical protein
VRERNAGFGGWISGLMDCWIGGELKVIRLQVFKFKMVAFTSAAAAAGGRPERSSSLYILRRRESVLGRLAERFILECMQVAEDQRNILTDFLRKMGSFAWLGD